MTWDNEKITSVDWRTYHSLPLGFEVPKIDAVLINRTEGEVMGAGETSITLVAAAIGNAIFDATGARIRQVAIHGGANQSGAGRTRLTAPAAAHNHDAHAAAYPGPYRYGG